MAVPRCGLFWVGPAGTRKRLAADAGSRSEPIRTSCWRAWTGRRRLPLRSWISVRPAQAAGIHGALASRRMADGQSARGRCVGPRLRPGLHDGRHQGRGRHHPPLCFQRDGVGGVGCDAQSAPGEYPTRRLPHRLDDTTPVIPMEHAPTEGVRAPATPGDLAPRLEARTGLLEVTIAEAARPGRVAAAGHGALALSAVGHGRPRSVSSQAMRGEVLGWDAGAGDNGIKHATAVEAPERGVL